ncbi:hypothetical protein D3C84_1069590 [compost metagenome]
MLTLNWNVTVSPGAAVIRSTLLTNWILTEPVFVTIVDAVTSGVWSETAMTVFCWMDPGSPAGIWELMENVTSRPLSKEGISWLNPSSGSVICKPVSVPTPALVTKML